MIVEELIERLKVYPKDMEVVVFDPQNESSDLGLNNLNTIKELQVYELTGKLKYEDSIFVDLNSLNTKRKGKKTKVLFLSD